MTRLKRSFAPMPVDKISGMLGLCRKAGKLVLGFDITVDAIVKKMPASSFLQRTLRRGPPGKLTRRRRKLRFPQECCPLQWTK